LGVHKESVEFAQNPNNPKPGTELSQGY